MSRQTHSSLFIGSPFAEHAEFYQQLIRGFGDYYQLGNRLIVFGERAHASRQFDRVKEIGLLLSNLPIQRYRAIGYYFLAVAANSVGNGDQDEAKKLFEGVVDVGPDEYKVKSILSLGALAFHKDDFDAALYFYRETMKAREPIAARLQAIRGITTLKSAEGYHGSAIKDLEAVMPLIRLAPTNVRLDCLNSYAVELSEAGRLHEAENVASLVIASPVAKYYPEWQGTVSEIRSKRKHRSAIAVSIFQSEPDSEDTSAVRDNVFRKARVRAVIDFMKANLNRDIRMSELAGVINLSTTQLYRCFVAETGVAAGEYLSRLRIEKAAGLLETSFLSIKQIVTAVGYNNRANFIRNFKRHLGATPSEYRVAKLRHSSERISVMSNPVFK